MVDMERNQSPNDKMRRFGKVLQNLSSMNQLQQQRVLSATTSQRKARTSGGKQTLSRHTFALWRWSASGGAETTMVCSTGRSHKTPQIWSTTKAIHMRASAGRSM